MYAKPATNRQQTFVFGLGDTLDRNHLLFRLARTINWEAFGKLYHPSLGRPCKSVRLMTGLLILKQLRDLSDEAMVEQWAENAYYQHFCGNA